jgi:hypothetical protein
MQYNLIQGIIYINTPRPLRPGALGPLPPGRRGLRRPPHLDRGVAPHLRVGLRRGARGPQMAAGAAARSPGGHAGGVAPGGGRAGVCLRAALCARVAPPAGIRSAVRASGDAARRAAVPQPVLPVVSSQALSLSP